MFSECFTAVRRKAPLIHNITNYVTVNDVANMVLACGASPIMADAPEDVEEVTGICGGLNLNLGTLNRDKARSMLLAGRRANELTHPVLFDPVGVGASSFRTETALTLLREVRFDVIRGNLSEIKALYTAFSGDGKGVESHGVDAAERDLKLVMDGPEVIRFLKHASEAIGSIIAVSGAVDLVADGKKCFCIYNGRSEMSRITGTGCQLSGLMTAFITANREDKLTAAAAAAAAMGLAGEIAYTHLKPYEGNASYRNRIIDAVYQMDGELLEKGARYEVR